MRILMVSPYPPTRDGIANYADPGSQAAPVGGQRRRGAVAGSVGRTSPPRPPGSARRDRAGAPGACVRPRDRAVPPGDVLSAAPLAVRAGRGSTWRWPAAFRAGRHVEVRLHEFPHAGAETASERFAAGRRCGRRSIASPSTPNRSGPSSPRRSGSRRAESRSRQPRRELRTPHRPRSHCGPEPPRTSRRWIHVPLDRVPPAAQGIRPVGARVRRTRRSRMSPRRRRFAPPRGSASTWPTSTSCVPWWSRRPERTCTSRTSATPSSTSGSWPPTRSCSRTGSSGRRRCASEPPSINDRSLRRGRAASPTKCPPTRCSSPTTKNSRRRCGRSPGWKAATDRSVGGPTAERDAVMSEIKLRAAQRRPARWRAVQVPPRRGLGRRRRRHRCGDSPRSHCRRPAPPAPAHRR